MTSIAPSAYRAPELRLPRLLAGVSYYHPTALAEHEELSGPLPRPGGASQLGRTGRAPKVSPPAARTGCCSPARRI